MTAHDALFNLIQQHSVRVVPPGQEFTLSSGRQSRVYCDLKKTALRKEAGEALARTLHTTSEALFGQVDAYAGVALGGCPLATLTAYYGNRHAIYVRKEAKNHGTQQLVEAPDIPKASRVVLLEDVTTTAESARKALSALLSGGYNVTGVLTVVDRRDDPVDNIEGVPVKSIFKLDEFIENEVSP